MFFPAIWSRVVNHATSPLSPIFPTPSRTNMEMFQPGCQPLIGFRITTARDHRISVKDLAAIQACLKPKIPELKTLRPTTEAKWIILFVVPDDMAASFVKQQFKDAAH